MTFETGRTYYEVLNVSECASEEEIREAFDLARSAYQEGSLATYSLFAAAEKEAALAELESAYRALSDPVRRREYNAQLGRKDQQKDVIQLKEVGSPSPLPLTETPDSKFGLSRGAHLRSVREAQGLSMSDVAEATSLNTQYIEALERETYDRMPSGSYRIFMLRAYAAHLGLDVEGVLEDFKSRVKT